MPLSRYVAAYEQKEGMGREIRPLAPFLARLYNAAQGVHIARYVPFRGGSCEPICFAIPSTCRIVSGPSLPGLGLARVPWSRWQRGQSGSRRACSLECQRKRRLENQAAWFWHV